MKGTVFLEPASTAAKHLQRTITDRSDDGLLFIACTKVEAQGAYLVCNPEPESNPNGWEKLVFAAKDVAFVVDG